VPEGRVGERLAAAPVSAHTAARIAASVFGGQSGGQTTVGSPYETTRRSISAWCGRRRGLAAGSMSARAEDRAEQHGRRARRDAEDAFSPRNGEVRVRRAGS